MGIVATVSFLGIHIIADFIDCSESCLDEASSGEGILSRLVKDADLNLIALKAHQFKPKGYTAFALLEESHISIHTWPEKKIALIDIFTCGNQEKAEKAFKLLKRAFSPEKVSEKRLDRGQAPPFTH